VLDHRGFEMTQRSGSDLLDCSLTAGQPHGVVFCGEVSDKGSNIATLTEQRQRPLKEGSLARARTRYKADDKHTSSAELLAKCTSRQVILSENVFANFD
jgi:hypothetical protein